MDAVLFITLFYLQLTSTTKEATGDLQTVVESLDAQIPKSSIRLHKKMDLDWYASYSVTMVTYLAWFIAKNATPLFYCCISHDEILQVVN